MAANAASHTIFFIISVLAAAALAGVMYTMVGQLSEGLEDRSNRLAEDIDTDFVIANDPRSVPYKNDILTIYAMNTGRISIGTEEVLIFVDGEPGNISAVTISDNLTVWGPGSTATFLVTASDLDYLEDHQVKIVLLNGNELTMDFRLPQGPRIAIDISNDPDAVPYKDDRTLTIYVRNTGDEQIDINTTTIMINGTVFSITNTSYLGGATQWDPMETAVFSVDVVNLSYVYTHRMKVIVQDDITDAIAFRVSLQGAPNTISISISNDPDAVPYKDNETLTIYVRNTGDVEIDTSTTTILINGTASSITNTSYLAGATQWDPKETAVFSVETVNLSYWDTHRMKVSVQVGADDAMTFKVKPLQGFNYSAISISNDLDAVPYKDNETLTIYVRNTGYTQIDINFTVIMINGTASNITNTSYLGGATQWDPDETAVFLVEAVNLSYMDTHRMKVTVQNGVTDAISFKVKPE